MQSTHLAETYHQRTIDNEEAQKRTQTLIASVLEQVTYKDWIFSTRSLLIASGGGFLLRVSFTAPERGTGTPSLQHGRWWYISPWSVQNEIVQTCLMAVLAAEEHEAREAFRYKSRPVFGPHFDTDALVSLSKNGGIEYRPDGVNSRGNQA